MYLATTCRVSWPMADKKWSCWLGYAAYLSVYQLCATYNGWPSDIYIAETISKCMCVYKVYKESESTSMLMVWTKPPLKSPFHSTQTQHLTTDHHEQGCRSLALSTRNYQDIMSLLDCVTHTQTHLLTLVYTRQLIGGTSTNLFAVNAMSFLIARHVHGWYYCHICLVK